MEKDQDKSTAQKEETPCETGKICNPKEEKSEAEQLSEKLAEEKERFVRLLAEFENYKKRVQKERLEFFKTAHQDLIIELLPILDDFERSLQEISQFEGVMLIREKFTKILQEKGLKKIDIKEGDDFNTDRHQAIAKIPAPNENLKGRIVGTTEAGYLLEDKVIRHAKVITGE